jgi:succinate-acetate transporter protein
VPAAHRETKTPSAKSAAEVNNDLGWIVLAFLIFSTYMLLWSAAVNLAIFGVFLTLEITEVLLVIGNFTSSGARPTTTIKVAGVVGVITAAVAWYASAAGVINGMRGRPVLFVGNPLIKPVNVYER